MSKTDFSWVNAVDTATITAGSEASGLPSANLASARYGAVWRSVASTSYFLANFTAATAINVLALAACTLAATDQVRHRLWDGPNGTGSLLLDVTVNSGVLPGYGLHVYKLTNSLSPMSWRCDITATSRASLGYFDIARAWAAPVWQPAVGIIRPWDETWVDAAAVTRGALSGGVYPGDGPVQRMLNLSLAFMSEADKLQAKEMSRVCGVRFQALIIPDEDGNIPAEAILGHFLKQQPITNSQNIVPPVYGQSFNILQDL